MLSNSHSYSRLSLNFVFVLCKPFNNKIWFSLTFDVQSLIYVNLSLPKSLKTLDLGAVLCIM